jgi:hypothetical protein
MELRLIVMKLNVGDKVLLNTAAGIYRSEIVDCYRAKNAAGSYCEWYTYAPLDDFTSTGRRLRRNTGNFNEFLANSIVKEVL